MLDGMASSDQLPARSSSTRQARNPSLLDGARESSDAERDEQQPEPEQHGRLPPQILDPEILEQDATQDLEVVRERQHEPEPLRRERHRLTREHEAREQDHRQHEEEADLHRLHLVARQRRDPEPDAEHHDDEQQRQQVEQRQAPPHRNVEEQLASARMTVVWTRPTIAKGRIFPSMMLVLPIGVTMSCSRVPRSRSRTIAMLVMSSIVIESGTPMIPGTM